MTWAPLEAPPGLAPSRPITVRAQAIPARRYFAEHAHPWHQIVYATSGVLTVAIEGRSLVISSEQAVWLPTGVRHRVGSLLGAAFRSLWIADEAGRGVAERPTVLAVQPLLRALILEAVAIEGQESQDGYADRVGALILDQLRRAQPVPGALPWPCGGPLVGLCEDLYADPADPRGPEDWGREFGMSGRTLARRFAAEVGLSLRSWRRRLRLFKAIELMGGGLNVTQTAMQLGYASTSAFVFAFRTGIGRTPQAYMREQGAGGPGRSVRQFSEPGA